MGDSIHKLSCAANKPPSLDLDALPALSLCFVAQLESSLKDRLRSPSREMSSTVAIHRAISLDSLSCSRQKQGLKEDLGI